MGTLVNIIANVMPLFLESTIRDRQIFLTTSRLFIQTIEKIVNLIRHLIPSFQSIKLRKGILIMGGLIGFVPH